MSEFGLYKYGAAYPDTPEESEDIHYENAILEKHGMPLGDLYHKHEIDLGGRYYKLDSEEKIANGDIISGYSLTQPGPNDSFIEIIDEKKPNPESHTGNKAINPHLDAGLMLKALKALIYDEPEKAGEKSTVDLIDDFKAKRQARQVEAIYKS